MNEFLRGFLTSKSKEISLKQFCGCGIKADSIVLKLLFWCNEIYDVGELSDLKEFKTNSEKN